MISNISNNSIKTDNHLDNEKLVEINQPKQRQGHSNQPRGVLAVKITDLNQTVPLQKRKLVQTYKETQIQRDLDRRARFRKQLKQ